MCAVIKQGILGGFSGKVAGVVGSSWKGIAVMKSLPLSVANPKTAGQIAQRTKFSNSVAFAGFILATVIKPLWDRFASQMSGYNEFVKSNIAEFAAWKPATAANLIISKGKMAASAIIGAGLTAASKNIVIEWTDDTGEGFKLTDDVAYVVVVNETQEIIEGFETAVERNVELATVVMKNNTDAADVVNCYLAFKRADGTVVSNTSFLLGTF